MRRVVTATAADGASFAAFDGEPPTRFDSPPNHVLQLWATGSEHAPSTADPTIGLPLQTDLAPGSTRSVFIEFGPGSRTEMHETKTVDVVYVTSGEITVELDREHVVLRKGDVLVQQGTRHGWHNHSSEPCGVLVHVVGV
jgi:quercetin dioxygenase-like cupin family protein